MFGTHIFYLLCLVGVFLLGGSWSAAEAGAHLRSCSGEELERVVKMGVIADNSSRLGREQIVAIQMAFQQQHLFSNSCYKLELLLWDSPDNSAHATATALNLIAHKQVKAILGTLTREEVSSIYELHKPSKNIPIISLSSSSLLLPNPKSNHHQLSSFLQMANDITHQIHCIASIVGEFRWQRVVVLYEDKNEDFTTNNIAILKLLSDSLRDFNSEIENHIGFSLSDPKFLMEEKLMKLSRNGNRVFILVQSSIEFAILVFKIAQKLNMMGDGYVWIVGDQIANLMDSLDSSAFHNLQGVIGCKIHYEETKTCFKKFKTKFRMNYMSKFPEEEGDPSIYALRAYDAYKAMENLKVVESKFEGLSGEVSFKNGILSQLPKFKIINVYGKSYKEIAFWSPRFGFSDILYQQTSIGNNNATFNLSSLLIWPELNGFVTCVAAELNTKNVIRVTGNAKGVPKGWDFTYRQKALKIGVPTTAAFQEFVRVDYNPPNGPHPHFSGFSIHVFQLIASNLKLTYDFLPFNKSYDDLLKKVYNKELDGAVGDFGMFADRFRYVDFTEPYLENAAVMIVKEKPLKWTRIWLFMRAFTTKMWLLMLFMHIFVSSAIWLVERKHNAELMGIGNMLWFSVSLIFYLHREPVKSGLGRLVLGPWLFTILIVTASFTASLSSMMTISRSQPSFLDIETLKLQNATVGCNTGSAMKRTLTDVMSFHPENVKEIASVDLFPNAFENREIKAAFMSAPHAKVFLAKHCKAYTKVTIFKFLGMAFAFQKGSALTVEISAVIADMTERREIPDLKTSLLSTFNCSSNDDDTDGSGLGPEPFAGLLFISGVIATMALLITASRLLFFNFSKPHIPI